MTIFNTPRLVVHELKRSDKSLFFELLSDPELMASIPMTRLTRNEIEQWFIVSLNYNRSAKIADKTIWGVYEKGNPNLIGLCGLLTNDEGDKKLGYLFRVPYWGKGYGAEITQGALEYCFTQLGFNKLTADVNIANRKSLRIFEKFFNPVRQFRNLNDNYTDQRFAISKKEWALRSKLV